MRPRSRTALSLLAAALCAVALTSCNGDSSSGDDPDPVATTAVTVTTVVTGPPPGAELQGLRDLEIGQCFERVDDPAAEDKAVWVVNCTDPHTSEVYDVITYEGDGSGRGTSYPGAFIVQNYSEEQCNARFEAFVGVRWTISDLDIEVWWPSEDSWARADRTILCTVVSASGDMLTGTQAGVAR